MSNTHLQLPSDWNVSRDIIMLVGEGAQELGRHFVKQGLKRVVVLCPPPTEPGPVPEGVALVRSEAELTHWLRKRRSPAKNIRILRTPTCSVSKEVTQQYTQVLQRVAQQQRDFLSPLFNLSPLWTRNGIRNFAHVAKNPMIGDLQTAFSGVPIIIVGAGPSLEKNIHLLKEAKGKAIILAVNRTLRSLQNAGIYPDLTITLEARDVHCQFEGIAIENIPGVLLATTVDRNLFELDAQCFVSYYNQLALDGWMFDPVDQCHEAGSRGTVSHSAFNLALRWGCDPIILMGQDLSFPGGRYYHKDGADGETEAVYDSEADRWKLKGYSQDRADTLKGEENVAFEGTMVPGYYGQEVPTSTSFAQYRAWFEHVAEQVQGKRTLFNCTEGGAFIAGMDHKPLATVLDSLPNRQIDVGHILADPDLIPARQARFKRMQKRLIEMTHHFSVVAELSKTCLTLVEKAQKRPKYLDRLQVAEAKFKQACKLVPVLNLATQEAIQNVIASSNDIKTTADSLRISKKLYAILNERAVALHQEAKSVCESFDEIDV
jgi:hypothetical protein